MKYIKCFEKINQPYSFMSMLDNLDSIPTKEEIKEYELLKNMNNYNL